MMKVIAIGLASLLITACSNSNCPPLPCPYPGNIDPTTCHCLSSKVPLADASADAAVDSHDT